MLDTRRRRWLFKLQLSRQVSSGFVASVALVASSR